MGSNKCEYPGCDFACIDYLKYTLDTVAPPDEVAALLFETIQTPGGYVIPPEGYWKKVKKVCDENGIMTIADEIITSIKWGEDEYGLPEPTFMMANGKPSKWPCEHYFIEEFDFNPDEVSQ